MAVFRALKKGLIRLSEYYKRLDTGLASTPAPSLPGHRASYLHLPYPLQPPLFMSGPEGESGSADHDGSYFGLLPSTAVPLATAVASAGDPLKIAGKLMYLARMPKAAGELELDSGDESLAVVVKFIPPDRAFAGGAAQAVHELWASHDLAPKLHSARLLQGGWSMVVMEYLGPEDGPAGNWCCLADLRPPPPPTAVGQAPVLGRGAAAVRQLPEDSGEKARVWRACVGAVKAALRLAHALRLNPAWAALGGSSACDGGESGLPTVHGDARALNVMVRVTPAASVTAGGAQQPSVEVRFVDFDWAGVVVISGPGGARCPSIINRAAFPAGVIEGGALSQALDEATFVFSTEPQI